MVTEECFVFATVAPTHFFRAGDNFPLSIDSIHMQVFKIK